MSVKETSNIYFGDQQRRSGDTHTKSCYLIPTLTKAYNVQQDRGERKKKKIHKYKKGL